MYLFYTMASFYFYFYFFFLLISDTYFIDTDLFYTIYAKCASCHYNILVHSTKDEIISKYVKVNNPVVYLSVTNLVILN